ncbi:MAG: NYN domain-containing protein [Clostridia bacterium]|nr:NYN domain-containing protein [Clostridia bacterium]
MNNTVADKKIAVLIDAENISEKYIKHIVDELANYGTPTYKRIYGDWTNPQLTKWKASLLDFSIQPIQQYSYTTGKSASDSAMIIDAMDILYSGKVDGFCLVSSDSDFTKLAARLREAGMLVIGMGEKKTPTPFIRACERFLYLEVLLPEPIAPKVVSVKENAVGKTETKTEAKGITTDKKKIASIIRDIIDDMDGDDGWAYLADVGNILSKREPDFDARNYGFRKFSDLVLSMKSIEVNKVKPEGKNVTQIYVRIKK